ncbi:MAG: tRNA pseudouridine(55) synthase TruB [Ferruginibacter sp.]
MAKKQTYRFKHADKIIQAGAANPNSNISRKPAQPVDPLVQQQYLEGQVILIDKPVHWTSFDVVRKLRNALQIKKIGHAGTLDPLATGLLIVCTGKFTKKINEYMAKEKEYTGHITLGATTPTYDLESEPANFKEYTSISPERIHSAASTFTGEQQQFPPVYSAIKKDGVALYELARRGEEVELKSRTITVHHFEITAIDLPVLSFKVTCSTGTYIRSLAHDLGQALGCGAYLSSLRRTKIGEFNVEDAPAMEKLLASFEKQTAL